jgi:hypothetical protein
MSAIPLLFVVSRSAPEESRSLLVPAGLVLTGLAQLTPLLLELLAMLELLALPVLPALPVLLALLVPLPLELLVQLLVRQMLLSPMLPLTWSWPVLRDLPTYPSSTTWVPGRRPTAWPAYREPGP